LDVAGDGVAGQGAAHFGDVLEAAGEGDLEVGGAGDAVELVEVVGHDAEVDEAAREVDEGFWRVVDVAEEDGLVEDRDAGIDEAGECGGGRVVNFARVVGVDDQDGSEASAAEPVEKALRNALGDDDGEAGVDAEAADVGNPGDAVGELGEVGIDERERVAAGEDDFVQCGVGGEEIEGGLPGVGGTRGFAVRIVPAEAVAAVDGAGAGGDQEGSAAVFLQEAGGKLGVAVADGIGAEARLVG